MHVLRCMASTVCVKFQKASLKFHARFWTHTPQNMHFTVLHFSVWVTISLNCDVISLSETGPREVVQFVYLSVIFIYAAHIINCDILTAILKTKGLNGRNPIVISVVDSTIAAPQTFESCCYNSCCCNHVTNVLELSAGWFDIKMYQWLSARLQ